MDKLKMEELPEPMGNFIIEQKDLYYLQLPDGRYWHYKDVVTMLSRLLKSRFNPSHSIGEEIVKKLEEANPWTIHTDNWNRDRDIAWKKCIETLRSLINQQSLNNKEGI